MSTKVQECCPWCGTANLPTDTPVSYEERWGYYAVKLWRYVCGECGWVWANDAQREHNNEARRRAYRDARAEAGAW